MSTEGVRLQKERDERRESREGVRVEKKCE